MKIAVIGAGVAGLAALRRSLDEGHECVAFEQTGNVGGTWNYVEEVGSDEYGLPIHSSMYKGLRTNTPKELMEFEDFPYTRPKTSYISQSEVLEYINDYAKSFNLGQHIKLLVHVQLVDPLPEEKWKIRIKYLQTGIVEEDTYDAVIVCVGNYSVPKTPEMEGMDRFKGRVIHSHNYRTVDRFVKRKLLIVGDGGSGVDISNMLTGVADKVFISIRNKLYFTLSEKVIIKPEILRFEEDSVTFNNGTKEVIDDVIFCTGYIYSYPFLSPNCGITVDEKLNWVKPLYKQIVNIEHPTMGFIGIPFRVTPFPIFGIQVRFFLEFLKGTVKIGKEEMLKELNEYMEKIKSEAHSQKHAHFLGLNQAWYMDNLAETANIKKVAPVINKFFEHLVTKPKETENKNISYRILNDNEFVQEENTT